MLKKETKGISKPIRNDDFELVGFFIAEKDPLVNAHIHQHKSRIGCSC